MHEYLVTVAAAFVLTAITSHFRLLVVVVIASLLAAICGWGCWRIGRLFNLAYRPGPLTATLALLAAITAGYAVITVSTLTYSRALVHSVFQTGRVGLEQVSPQRVCEVVDWLLPYLGSDIGEEVTLNCTAAASADGLRSQFGDGVDGLDRWLQGGLARARSVTLAGTLVLLAICFTASSWRAYRGLRLYAMGDTPPPR